MGNSNVSPKGSFSPETKGIAMNRLASCIFGIALAAMAFTVPARSSVYHVAYSGGQYGIDALVTTDDLTKVAQSASGSFFTNGLQTATITGIIPTSTDPWPVFFYYDNLLDSTNSEWINSLGLLFCLSTSCAKNAGGTAANLFFESGRYQVWLKTEGVAGYPGNDSALAVNVGAVPIPTTLPLMASGLAGVCFLARRRNKRSVTLAA
jgi:hypothetical protein